MTKEAKIISCIVCDITRQEEGGKTTLLGVYPKSVAVTKLPAILPNFGIWVEVLPAQKKNSNIEFEIVSPDKKTLVKGKGKLEISSTDYPIGLPIQFHHVTFNVAGKYVIKFAIDGAMKKIGEFTVLKNKLSE